MGPGTAGGFLQRALNALNRNGRDYLDLKVDKAVGAKTIAALGAFLAVRGRAGEKVLLKALEALQGERYRALAESRDRTSVGSGERGSVRVDVGGSRIMKKKIDEPTYENRDK